MASPVVEQINAELETLQKELKQFKSTVGYLSDAKENLALANSIIESYDVLVNAKAKEIKSTLTALDKLDKEVNDLLKRIDLINFPERLDKFEEGFVELLSINSDLKKEINHSSKLLDEQIDKIDFTKKFKELNDTVSKIVGSNDILLRKINELNIPGRINELLISITQKTDGLFKTIVQKLDASAADLQNNTKQIAESTAKSILDLNLPLRMDKLDANISGILTAIQNVQVRIESVERNIADKLRDSTDKQISSVSALQEKISSGISTLTEAVNSSSKKQKTNAYITWALIVLVIIVVSLLIKL